MSELGTERDQLTNENTQLDEHISDLTLQKNMVDFHLIILLLVDQISVYFRC
jgi:hypothetical protein